ncbi:MAG: undecaprenyl-diphosphate phosphatase [Bdellovibrionales bacterium]
MNTWQATLLAVVEGLTEYLPISSTGHIILTSWMMGIHHEEFVKDFTVMVQFGAILSVVILYWRRFVLNYRLYPAVFLAFLPAAVVGLAVKKHIDEVLDSVMLVGIALSVGGVLLVLTDRWLARQKVRVARAEDLSKTAAIKIGIFQLMAFFPGVSRSAATIWGGLYQGMSLVQATEFSFFLAVPTLTGASFIKLLKVWPTLDAEKVQLLLIGNVISFFVGIVAVHYFVRLVARYGLKGFGYYRVVLGILVLLSDKA